MNLSVCVALLAAAGQTLWETNVSLVSARAREAEKLRFSVAEGRIRVEHQGERDWWINPQPELPEFSNAIALVEVAVTFAPSAGGEVAVGFLRRNASGGAVEWMHRARSLRTAATGAVLRATARIPADGSLAGRLTGSGPGVLEAGPLRLAVVSPPPLSVPRRAEVANGAMRVTLDAADATLLLTDLRSGRQWRSVAGNDNWQAADLVVQGRRLAWRVVDAVDRSPLLQAALELAEAQPEAVLAISSTDGPAERPTAPLAYPASWAPEADAEIILPMNEGIGYPVDDPAVTPGRLAMYSGHGLCMAFYGVVSGEAAAMAIVETPDDAAVRIARVGGRLTVGPEWEPQHGRWGYPRRLRWCLFDRGGYVAMCQRYREHARRTGLLVTFREKAARNPNVAMLAGAANVWFMDRFSKIEMGRELRAAGIDRVLWSAGGSSNEIAELTRMGFLVGRYDIYQDCMDPAQFPRLHHVQADWTSDAWPTGVVRRADGDWERGWRVRAKDGSMIPCAVLCDRLAPDRARRRIGEELSEKPYRARFIDTTTASPWRECYDPAHPMTRTDSRRFKMELLGVVSREFNLVCGSETGHDAAVPFADYFEGMLSLGPYRVPDAGRDIMKKWDEPPERLVTFQTGHRYRLPLWELVYHDCVVAQWYWGDYNNKIPKLWGRRDLWNALYGTPPMYMFNRTEWLADRERFVRSFRIASPVAARTMFHPMVDHRRLKPDGAVQQSRFADGTVVTVNFGAEPFDLGNGRILAPESVDMSLASPALEGSARQTSPVAR